MINLAVIGCGARSSNEIKNQLAFDREVKLAAVADLNKNSACSWLDKQKVDYSATEFFDSAEKLLENADQYDGLLIGTNCVSHTPIAIAAAKTNLPIYLEKPVAVSAEQLQDLVNAFAGKSEKVLVGFPLRHTPILQAVLEIIASGRLGTINQVQAVNNVNYGGCYFGNWYRDNELSHGLWLQKATHDFDYINQILQSIPTMIAATTSQKIFKGDKPHNLRCSQCKVKTCYESPDSLIERGDSGGMNWGNINFENDFDHWCAFSSEIKNHDAGSAIICYENGVHASYVQNFISRRSAVKRGAIITGYLGTLNFDFYSDKITVIDHMKNRIDNIEVMSNGNHSGGDYPMTKNFNAMMHKKEISETPLAGGIISCAMCLAAEQSSQNNTFEPIIRYTL